MSSIQANGTYSLTNAKGGTCLDLSGGDNTTLIGYGYHNGPNQHWTFENADKDKTFHVKAGNGQFLAPSSTQDGAQVCVRDAPYAWVVEDASGVEGGVRLMPAEDARYCVDLSRHGDSTPGTPVELWGRWEGENQVWKAQRVQ